MSVKNSKENKTARRLERIARKGTAAREHYPCYKTQTRISNNGIKYTYLGLADKSRTLESVYGVDWKKVKKTMEFEPHKVHSVA